MTALKSQYKKLKNEVKEGDETIAKLSNDIVYIKGRLSLIENVLLPKETDDSKIRTAAVTYNNGTVHNRESADCCGQTDPADSLTETFEKRLKGHQSHAEYGTILNMEDLDLEDYVPRGATGGSDDHRDKKLDYHSGDTISKKSLQLKASVVKQDVQLVYDGERHWRFVSQMERYRNRELFQDLEDIHVIICLDISESMAQSNGWTEAHTFLTDYLTGLENMSKSNDLKTEHVAFITFGHETKIQRGYTNSYMEVREQLDELKLGGPTQMYGGILLADAVAFCTRFHIVGLNNGAQILTKIIIISDGRPTESDLIAGPDIQDTRKVDETKAKILQEMEDFRRTHRDVFFVPVGNSDLDFFDTMAACSNGMLLDYRYGKRFSRRQYLTKQLLDPFGMMTHVLTRGLDYGLSNEDKEDMRNIQERGKRHFDEQAATPDERNMYGEIKSKQLPSVGSRVRRGPDWHYQNQDKNGPGTLIGQCENDQQVWVEWDTDAQQNVYHYGSGGYDILVVDEPRKLKPGENIAVGCKVKPGKAWKSSEGQMNHGTVIKMDKRNKTAMVRWNNGKRGEYSYDDDKLEVIEIERNLQYSGDSHDSAHSNVAPNNEWKPQQTPTIEEFAAKQTKNKNKNIR
ncbi:uncharacterized protein LOC123554779 isoform X2 [Mercenaria mercenaria]|nr:uncharacterized protein LOC123554779 isoform X2 [Mercenaria mercenaria]